MKVLIFTDDFLPSLGGVQRHTYTLSRYLSENSCSVHVATSRSLNQNLDQQFDEAFEHYSNIKISRILARRSDLPFLHSINYLTESRKVVEYLNKYGNDYDIIHYHGSRQLLFRFIKSRTPVVTSVHGIFPACIWQLSKPCQHISISACAVCDLHKNLKHAIILPLMIPYYYIYYDYIKKSLCKISRVICVSDFVRSYIQTKIPELGNLVALHNFIDFQHEVKPELESNSGFDARASLNLSSTAKIIVYFGRLSEEKGVDLLIDAFRLLKQKTDNDVYLLIGGEGPRRTQLEQNAKSIKGILFLGSLPRGIQLSILAQSNVFVHPSQYPDACPTSILEAMVLGVPIVATRLGGVPELVVEGKNGLLVNSNSSIALANKILVLLTNEKFKIQTKVFNETWCAKFDIAFIGPKILELYKAVLG